MCKRLYTHDTRVSLCSLRGWAQSLGLHTASEGLGLFFLHIHTTATSAQSRVAALEEAERQVLNQNNYLASSGFVVEPGLKLQKKGQHETLYLN